MDFTTSYKVDIIKEGYIKNDTGKDTRDLGPVL